MSDLNNNELPKQSKTNRNIMHTNNSINEIPNTNKEVIIKTKNEDKNNISKEKNLKRKKTLLIIIISVLASLILIAGIIFLIGYFAFNWFHKKQDLIVEIKRDENLVMRYLEIKNVTNYYDIDGLSEVEKRKDDSLVTDLIVGINKKTKKEYLGEIDYLYEAYLLIINISKINDTNYDNLGGLNIYNESISLDELININNNLFYINNKNNNYTNNQSYIPFCKFNFYENGTIDDIYFPINTNEFYKSVILDLIEKAIPKLSKSLYNIKENKRKLDNKEEGIYLNYEKTNNKNGENINTIIYEDKLKKNIDDDINFDNSELNSTIKRVFNSSGDMVNLEMKGEAIFKSNKKENNEKISKIENEKIIKSNISYYSLGYNQFKMNVSSKMNLIQNKKEIKTIEILNNLSEKLNFEKLKNSNSSSKESEDINIDINAINKKRKLLKNPNYSNSYQLTYNLMTTSFLGLSIGINQGLYINNKTGLRKGHIDAVIGENKFTLSYLNYYYIPFEKKNGTISKNLFDKELEGPSKDFKIFGYLISAELNLNFNANHGISYGIDNDELYTKSFSDFDVNIEGSFGPKFIVFSFGVALTGHIVTGEAYIQANTLLNNNSNLARVEYYKEINSCAVDISFYFSVYLLFYEKKFSKDIRLYEGFSSFEKYYKDV